MWKKYTQVSARAKLHINEVLEGNSAIYSLSLFFYLFHPLSLTYKFWLHRLRSMNMSNEAFETFLMYCFFINYEWSFGMLCCKPGWVILVTNFMWRSQNIIIGKQHPKGVFYPRKMDIRNGGTYILRTWWLVTHFYYNKAVKL